MAILLLTGLPGAGKSYSAVALGVIPALDMGRPIFTNVPLDIEAIKKRWPISTIEQIDPSDDETWARIPGGALVMIDEVGTIWPAGQKAQDAPPAAVQFVAMHRHHVGPVAGQALSCEMVVMSQGSTDFAKWLRSRVDRTYVIRKLDAVGATKTYKCQIYAGFQDTARPLARDLIDSLTGTYQEEVYGLYKSHTLAQDVAGLSVRELRADKRTVWDSWTVRAAGLAALAFVPVAYAAWDRIRQPMVEVQAPASAETPRRREAEAQSLRVLPATYEAPVPAIKPPEILPESSWSITGVCEWDGSYTVVIWHPEHGQKTLRKARCDKDNGELSCVFRGERMYVEAAPIKQVIQSAREQVAQVIPFGKPQ